jgi:peptidoglycan LD-endopeptidase LytH
VRVLRVSFAVAALVVAATIGLPAEAAGASASDLEAAKKRANQAAAQLAKAQSELSELQADAAALRTKATANEERLTTLRSSVRNLAIGQYVSGTLDGSEVAFDPDLSTTARNQVLSRYVSESSDDDLDEYRQMAEDLTRDQQELDAKEKQSSAAAAEMRKRVAAAEAELKRLAKLEEERKAAEAKKRAEQAAAAARASKASTSTRAASSRSGGSFAATGDWMCPVQGARAFSNDWGNPRSGGRRHQGTDMLSPRGTPVVAPVSGSIHRNDSSNGGVSFYLMGVDGIEYFGAHLDSYVGGSGQVSQGQIVGYVGNTGNARGGPTHLHFEIHPGGGGAVNPYPTVSRYC